MLSQYWICWRTLLSLFPVPRAFCPFVSFGVFVSLFIGIAVCLMFLSALYYITLALCRTYLLIFFVGRRQSRNWRGRQQQWRRRRRQQQQWSKRTRRRRWWRWWRWWWRWRWRSGGLIYAVRSAGGRRTWFIFIVDSNTNLLTTEIVKTANQTNCRGYCSTGLFIACSCAISLGFRV